MKPVEIDNVGLPASPRDVVEYLVQNEPLTCVAEISRFVDGYTSRLKQDSFAIESLNAAIDTEQLTRTSVDELLTECQGIYSTVRKYAKEVDEVVETRSGDLLRAIAQLRSTPLTTPSVSSLGTTTSSIAQMSAKVEDILTIQTDALNVLEASRSELEVALSELSSRGKSTKQLLGTFAGRTHRVPSSDVCESRSAESAVSPLDKRTFVTPKLYDSLLERYDRISQEFRSGVDRIVKNGETIRDLALMVEKVRSPGPTITAQRGGFLTLAEELSERQAQNTDTVVASPQNLLDQSLRWRSPSARLVLLRAWMEYQIRDLIAVAFARLPVQPPFLVSISLMALVVLGNIIRAGHRARNLGHAQDTIQTTTYSIRDLLLGDRAGVSDELIHNLVPRR